MEKTSGSDTFLLDAEKKDKAAQAAQTEDRRPGPVDFAAAAGGAGAGAKNLLDKAGQAAGKLGLANLAAAAGAGMGEKAKDLLDKAGQAAGQMGGGADFAKGVEGLVKREARDFKAAADQKMWQLDLKLLRPIFPTRTKGALSLEDPNFQMSKLIQIVDRDKRRRESPACKGSIGYSSYEKGLRIVNIFRDSVGVFHLTFYPDLDNGFYYMDPVDRDHYIALYDYFVFLEHARVNELTQIAQSLGATYFKVTSKEKRDTAFGQKIKAGGKVAAVGAEAEHRSRQEQFASVKVMAELAFPGHEPVMPQLKYLQKDQAIQNLITLRMNETAPLLHQHFELDLHHAIGLKQEEALKIDAILKMLKCSGKTSIASEVKKEESRYLEYEIEF